MLIVTLCVAYLLGSFPTAVVLSRLLAGDDVRTHGSGNPGASNVARTYGMKLGVAVAALDILKGLAPVVIAQRAGLPAAGTALVAVAAVLGHDFSAFLRFDGGKGVATTFGVALALAPLAGGLALIAWLAVIIATGYSSLASLVALFLLPIVLAMTGGPAVYTAAAVALFLLALWKHRENVLRLWNGTERKFSILTPANGA